MHVLSGILRKQPFYKQLDGDKGHMWAIELSEVNKDKDTQQNEFTNYQAALFAKTPGQAEFYNNSLVEGAFVVVSCEKLRIKKSYGQNNQEYISLQMENSKLQNVSNPNQPVNQPHNQGGFSQPQAQQQAGNGYDNPAPMPQRSGFNTAPQNQPRPQGGFMSAPPRGK